MIKKEILITNGQNKLHGVIWTVDNPVAIVILIHGLGEHSGRYEHVADFFNRQNLAFIAFDLPGHGQSSGKRGHIKQISDYYDSIDAISAEVALELPNLPVVLYGHSMGGNIVLNYLINRDQQPFCCAIATSPWLRLAIKPGAFQLILAKTMNHILPGLQQPNGLDVGDISSVAEEQEKYKNDPLNHDKISIRLFNEVFEAGLKAIASAGAIKIPLLVAHGSEDHITSAAGSEEFVKNSSSSTLKIWPGLRHETQNEHNKEEVIDFYVNWVLEQLAEK